MGEVCCSTMTSGGFAAGPFVINPWGHLQLPSTPRCKSLWSYVTRRSRDQYELSAGPLRIRSSPPGSGSQYDHPYRYSMSSSECIAARR